MKKNDLFFLKIAVAQAEKSVKLGGFPAGAVLVKENQVFAKTCALGSLIFDPTSHPDIAAVRQTCRQLKTTNLSGFTIYTTLEPCLMCFMASTWAGITRIVYACRRKQVSLTYYANSTNVSFVNKRHLHPLKLDFIADFESDVLKIITKWENINHDQ